jgi:hypothetical protein
MEKWKIALGLGLLLATGLLAGWNHHMRSPQYALQRIAKAVETKDRLLFERHVDLDALVNRAVDDLVGAAMGEAMADEADGFAALGAMIGGAMIEGAKPMIRQAARDAIDEGFASGDFAGLDSGNGEFDLAELTAGAGLGKDAFRGLDGVRRRDDIATVGLRFHEAILDTTLVLEVRMARVGKVWRLTAVENLRHYIETISRLQDERVAAENARIDAELAALIEVGALRRTVRNTGWFGQEVALSATITNIGTDTITTVMVEVVGPDGKVFDRQATALFFRGAIAPGTSDLARESFELNPYIDWHMTVAQGDVRIRPYGVATTRGGSERGLARLTNWESYLASLEE